MARRPERAKWIDVEVMPSSGGKLMTRVTAEKPSLTDYTIKRDFRRDYDVEMRREGHVPFWPNRSQPLSGYMTAQNIPSAPLTNLPITMVHMTRMPNGQTAVIAATATTIYRYYAQENGPYLSTDPSLPGFPYFDSNPPDAYIPYFNDNPADWVVIGSGFSMNGHRWEVQECAGFCIINNGVDLPMTYQLTDSQVKPIWELREQGIACVGTICVYDGILMCADISEIVTSTFDALMALISSGTTTASQPGALYTGLVTNAVVSVGTNTLTSNNSLWNGGFGFVSGMVGWTIVLVNGFQATIATVVNSQHITFSGPPYESSVNYANGPFWVINPNGTPYQITANNALWNGGLGFTDGTNGTPNMVGQNIIWSNGQVRQIVSVVSSTVVTTDSFIGVASGTFGVTNPAAYATYSDQSQINRYQYRTLWSMINLPRRFGSIVPASIKAGSVIGLFQFPTKSFASGDAITFTGAGLDGGNLLCTIVYIDPSGLFFIVTPAAQTTVSLSPVEQSDAEGSIVGFYDLQDDGSGILRMAPLKAALVVFKETSIFLGLFTGVVTAPFQFQEVKVGQNGGARCLYYRWCLANIKDDFILYAGATGFWKFDLITQEPLESVPLALCSDLFFAQASLAITDQIFSWSNDVAQEVWFCFPSTTADAAIIFDWFRDTCSTGSAVITAGETIVKPLYGIQPDPGIKWGMIGLAAGQVAVYGLTNEGPTFGTASCSGNTVTSGTALFTADMIYKSIVFSNGTMANITAFTSATQVTVDGPAQTTSNGPTAIISQAWNRNGAAYSSTLQSGLSDAQTSQRAKQVRSYLPELSQDPAIISLPVVQSPFTVSLNAALNVADGGTNQGTEVITNFDQNLIPCWFLAYLIQDQITLSGTNNPLRVFRRTWGITELDSQGFERSRS